MNYFPKKKILITGGAGFIGSHLQKLFIRKGVEKTINHITLKIKT